jgi:hypothetical protein
MPEAPARIAGHFDGIDRARAVGWAADLNAPARILAVEFFSVAPDGTPRLLGRTRANRPRADLQTLGLTKIRHGFEWALPDLPPGCLLAARVAEGEFELPGGPIEVSRTATARLAGHLDRVKGSCALGWAADLAAPERILEVEFFSVAPDRLTTLLGRARADRPRADLRAVGLKRVRHGFEWPIPDLAPGYRLGARIAEGDFALAGSPIEVSLEKPARIAGQLDRVEGSRAVGWAADLDAPERILEVEFFRVRPDENPIPLGRARANRPRDDLQSIGLTTTHHGFDWRIPHHGSPFRLTARVAESEVELPGSSVEITSSVIYEGTVDGIVRGVLRGWAWAWDPAISVVVEVFVDGRLCGTTPADAGRADLVMAHLGDGRHGFAWVVPEAFSDGMPHEFACRIAGTSIWLAGSPHTAIVPPGHRATGIAALQAVRGYARRPLPRRSARRGDLPSPAVGTPGPAEPAGPTESAVGSGNWANLSDGAARPATGAAQRIRMLIPIWGQDYISLFCRTALPSLLSPNNLPYLARVHSLEIAFLTRAADRASFAAHPAYRRLETMATVTFIDIDDIVARYFEPAPEAYATALTYAFHRGIRSAGAAALETHFVFWNADFLAADGAFRTLAELIAAGVRCTFAPSLRVDPAAETALPAERRSGDGSVLDIGPREWVSLAMRFPHPTVKAQTLNRFEVRMIDTVNQLYWHIDDRLMVARVFLMFMLHMRPEVVWDEVHGHCDYVFAPEMVPSSDYHFETTSDRLLIIELQHHNREARDIVYGDAAMTPAEIAGGVSRWVTREHRLASQHLVVFNAGDGKPDLPPLQQMTDTFMDEVYRQLPREPIWHNGHLFWADDLAALGLHYDEPGPERPRSHLAAALRGTGFDIDILRESWPTPPGPPSEIFDLPVPLAPGFEPAAWLATAHARYFRDWCACDPTSVTGPSETDLLCGHFHGFGWGLVERGAPGWARRLGPDGSATLLLRAPSTAAVSLSLRGGHCRDGVDALAVTVNGRRWTPSWRETDGGAPILQLDIHRAEVAGQHGRLRIDLRAPPRRKLGFSELAIRLG